jgi:hypothetical protein
MSALLAIVESGLLLVAAMAIVLALVGIPMERSRRRWVRVAGRVLLGLAAGLGAIVLWL